MLSDENLLGERYRLGSRLGRGGMGEVRLGLDVKLGRAVAIKMLSPELADDPAARERFQREARSAARLNHPSIVAVFDTGEADDPATGNSRPYIVMELVQGQTFGSLLRRGDQPSPKRALQLMSGVLAALAHSHDAGIVHQDIKPGNVMLDQCGDVKVMDFGIARSISDPSQGATPALTVLGSAHYLSPEQARGENTDVRSDIYSGGCLLYELLTGRRPFTGESPMSITVQHLHDVPGPPSHVNPLIDGEVDAVVLRALAKDPADRYQSARDMLADVTALSEQIAPAPVVSSAVSPVQMRAFVSRVAGPPLRGTHARTRPRRAVAVAAPSRGRRRSALLVAAVTAVVFPLGGFGLYSFNQPDAPEAQGASLSQVLQAPNAQADVRSGAPAVASSQGRLAPTGGPTASLAQHAATPASDPTSSATRAAGSAKASHSRRSAGAQGPISSSSSVTAEVPRQQAGARSAAAHTGQLSASTAEPISAVRRRAAGHKRAAPASASQSMQGSAPSSPKVEHPAHSAPTRTSHPSPRPMKSSPTPSHEPTPPVATRPPAPKSHAPAGKKRATGGHSHGQGPKHSPVAKPPKVGGHGSSGSPTPVPQGHQKPAGHPHKPKHVKKAHPVNKAKPEHAKPAQPGKHAKPDQHHKREKGVKPGHPGGKAEKAKKHGRHKAPVAATPPPVAADPAGTPSQGKGTHGHGKGRHKPKP